MIAAETWMAREIAEAPAVVAAQGDALKSLLHQLARRLRSSPPKVVVTPVSVPP